MTKSQNLLRMEAIREMTPEQRQKKHSQLKARLARQCALVFAEHIEADPYDDQDSSRIYYLSAEKEWVTASLGVSEKARWQYGYGTCDGFIGVLKHEATRGIPDGIPQENKLAAYREAVQQLARLLAMRGASGHRIIRMVPEPQPGCDVEAWVWELPEVREVFADLDRVQWAMLLADPDAHLRQTAMRWHGRLAQGRSR